MADPPKCAPGSHFAACCRLSALHVPALRSASCRASYEPPADAFGHPRAVRRPRSLRSSGGWLSSSLRSSSTHAAACAWRRVGSWLSSVLLEVKVNGASGGPGSGKEGVFCPAGCLLGGGVRLVVPLAWPRRQPGTCRECNRRRRRFVVKVVFAGCTPGRTLVGLRLPGEGNDQPRRRRVRCTQPRARCPMQNRASETPSDTGLSRPRRDGEKSPQTNHPTRTPRGNLTPNVQLA